MKKTRLVSILLALVLITSSFVGNTFAKYTSKASGSDDAFVAKWSISVEDTQIAVTPVPTFAFNLFSTINDTNGTPETDVAATLIAPGTTGSFTVDIVNYSQVTAAYTVVFGETKSHNIPIQYSIDDGMTWHDTITDINIAVPHRLEMTGVNASHSFTVDWRWAFYDSDDANADPAVAYVGQMNEKDTLLGIAAQVTAPQVTITATVTASQVD